MSIDAGAQAREAAATSPGNRTFVAGVGVGAVGVVLAYLVAGAIGGGLRSDWKLVEETCAPGYHRAISRMQNPICQSDRFDRDFYRVQLRRVPIDDPVGTIAPTPPPDAGGGPAQAR